MDGNGKEIDRYEVVGATRYTIHFLLPKMNYTVRVAIQNERKESPFSSVSFTTQAGKNFTISKKVTVSTYYIS